MRTVALPVAAVLALVVTGASQPAATATKAVAIKSGGFSPKTVTIATTDAIKWTNRDTKNHQIVANNGSFASATLAPGKSYTHMFNTAGTFGYHDALHPALKGKVVVKGPPPAITIGASQPILTYGASTHLSGAISTSQAGQTVTVWAQPYGQVSFQQVATLLTGTGGVWDTIVKPTLLTTYQVHWKNTLSDNIGVQLRPSVSLVTAKRWGSVKVRVDRSLMGKKVYLQKFTRFHEWVKVRPVFLNRHSQQRFRLLGLRPGYRYAVRIFMSLNQAGAGYLDGYSRTIVVKVPKKR